MYPDDSASVPVWFALLVFIFVGLLLYQVTRKMRERSRNKIQEVEDMLHNEEESFPRWHLRTTVSIVIMVHIKKHWIQKGGHLIFQVL